MSPETSRPLARVVLAVHDTVGLAELLAPASLLAQGRQAELTGLFIEEVGLVRSASLPVTREVGVASERVRDIDPYTTVRLLRRRADEVRRRIEREAAAAHLSWSFQVIRGTLVQAAVAATTPADLVILSPPPTAVQHTLGQRTAHPANGRVGAVYDDSDAGSRALTTARDLSGGKPEAIARVPPDEIAAGVARPARHRVLVVSLPSLEALGADLPGFLARVRCPVILVR